MRNKKGQLTVFIILAIVIVAVVIFLFINRANLTSIITSETPINQIKSCIIGSENEKNSFKGLISELSLQGGTLVPENYFLYENNKIQYLCYTEENYKRCIMQKPLLKNDIQEELKNSIKTKVTDCLNSFKDSFEKKGYQVSFKEPEINIELIPKTAIISLENLNLRLQKEKTESYSILKVDYDSKIYNFIMTADSIINSETRYGTSEIMSYMINYPTMRVEKKKQSDGTNVYILTDKDSGEKFMFATRSWAIPSGITGF